MIVALFAPNFQLSRYAVQRFASFVVAFSVDGGAPRQITSSRRPNWSHDGRWLYINADRTGEMTI